MSRNGENEGAPRPASPPAWRRKVKKQVPQKTVDDFWSAFTTKHPGKVHNILPKNPYARTRAAHEPKGTVYGHGAWESYDEAKAECVASVEKIAKECRRVNMRYRDPHFDIEWDLKSNKRDCLDGLLLYPDAGKPRSVKRIHQIFENPRFYIDGATAGDIRQGKSGDCWFLAALGALSSKKDLIEKVCVCRDEAVGVYGFVFYRDGEWIATVIDDKLYLSVLDWDESFYEKVSWLQIPNRQDAEEEYRKVYQTGSRALYFAQCNTENETWLPLLEKAFAKAHGDYYSIDGGFTGEAIEDLTGGVTTELFTSDILDVDQFWRDELMRVNEEFLFGCATGRFDDWQGGAQLTDRKGIQSGHAYSIMEAREVNRERLLKVRNPWGETEWNGPWSDGSEQWTPEWMQLLDHKFGDDGVFWISYKDLLRKYQFFDRTRLFGPEWSVTQQWTSVDVPWSADYNDTMFSFTLTQPTPIVIVLSQLDDRYWDGLQGQYNFSLHFRVSKDNEDDYIVRSHGNYSMTRSVSTELELESGCYTVRIRITATRYQRRPTVEEVIRMNCRNRQEKVVQIGMSYDLAHAKGVIQETEEMQKRKAEKQAKDEAATKMMAREEAKKKKYKKWDRNRKRIERIRREKERLEAHKSKKARQQEAGSVVIEASAKDVIPDGEQTSTNANPVKTEEQPSQALSTDSKVDMNDEKQVTAEEQESPQNDTPTSAISLRVEFDRGQKNNSVASPLDKMDPEATSPLDKSTRKTTALDGSVDSSQDAPENPSTEGEYKVGDVELTKREETMQRTTFPSVKANGEAVADQVLPTPPASPGVSAPRSVVSEPETVVTYASSFDSDLDELFFADELDEEDYGNGAHSATEGGGQGEDDDLEEYASDPWNAVCVVGLRVFTKEGKASVEVIRPPDNEEEDEKEQTPLDVDDPMKSMSDELVTPSSASKERKLDVSSRVAEQLASKTPQPKSVEERLKSSVA